MSFYQSKLLNFASNHGIAFFFFKLAFKSSFRGIDISQMLVWGKSS